MKLILTRTYGKLSTYGTLDTEDGKRLCMVIELPYLDNKKDISCIPAGTYEVKSHVSPKFGQCFMVMDVPDRSNILIHVGNYINYKVNGFVKTDSHGCLLPVADIQIEPDESLFGTNSRVSLKSLLESYPNGFTLEIR